LQLAAAARADLLSGSITTSMRQMIELLVAAGTALLGGSGLARRIGLSASAWPWQPSSSSRASASWSSRRRRPRG
jgi:hypothetical protein